MSQVTKTQAIKAFLTARTHADLAGMYNHDMETQITVAKDKGERVEGDFKGKQWHGYSDGIQTWKPIRIPLKANTEPEYTDSPMTWDLTEHAEGIGMTGWDWKAKISRWVAFDFDAITGHSEKHAKKLSDEELNAIRTALHDVPYVTIRKSTGGKGLHVYVFLHEIETANHTEHAAVARAVLSHLSAIANFDFNIRVDTCGGNMWVWHRKMTPENEGLKILKQGTELAHTPPNWKDYLSVVSGRRTKNLPRFVDPAEEDVFAQLTGQRLRIRLDDCHKAVMTWIQDRYPSAIWWDAEHYMMVTHTKLLKEAHKALNLKGQFDTTAEGTELGFDINVFGFPLVNGAWALRRYTPGVAEHPFWKQDGKTWTTITYNREASLDQIATVFKGEEKSTGGFWFEKGEGAIQAAKALGVNLELPDAVKNHQGVTLKMHRSGKLVVIVEKKEYPMPGWVLEGKKYTKMFAVRVPDDDEMETVKLDERIRHMITEVGDDCGWVIFADNEWHNEPFQHVKVFIKGLGYKPGEENALLGNNIAHCWKIVNLPFREEYPRDRQWNRFSARLRYTPSLNRDSLNYPTWTKVLNHLGMALNDVVKHNEWCNQNNIITGADYLKCWIASMFKEPTEPLPYLFFHGPQNSGKSLFHEMISLLMTRGVARADTALTSSSNFNGELEGAVLCVIEETDMRKNVAAYNRIKDWVTSRQLSIHKKGRQPYLIPNVTKYVQCSNSHFACPVFPGDSRVTMIQVGPIAPEHMIPKKQIIPLLEAEASDFLAEIFSLELPASPDRLNLPCLNTEDKVLVEEANKSQLQLFVEQKCFYAPGYKTTFKEFKERFHEWLDPNQIPNWGQNRIAIEFPTIFAKGKCRSTNAVLIGNISFEPVPEKDWGPKFFITDGKLNQ